MAEFEGFSDVSLLYCENYGLVHQMYETFKGEREILFQVVGHRIVLATWYDAELFTLDIGEKRIDVRLGSPASERALAYARLELTAGRLGRRSLYAFLWLETPPPNVGLFRKRLREVVPTEMLSTVEGSLIPVPKQQRYLVNREVPFDLEALPDVMFAAMENMQQLFPYVEQVYREMLDEGTL